MVAPTADAEEVPLFDRYFLGGPNSVRGFEYREIGPRDEDGEYIKMDVEEGDEVIFSKYGGTEVKIDDQKYTLVREDDILGVIV